MQLGRTVFRYDPEKALEIAISTLPLGNICYVSYGLRANSDDRKYLGEFTTDDCLSSVKDATHPKPFVQGKDLGKWVPQRIWFLEWGTDRAPRKFSRRTFDELHETKEKLIAMRTPGIFPRTIYDNGRLYFDASSVGFILWHHLVDVRNKSIQKTALYKKEVKRDSVAPRITREDLEMASQQFDIKYLLGIVNSTFTQKWLSGKRRSKRHVYPDDWKIVPIASIPLTDQQPLVDLVDKILAEYAMHGYPLPEEAATRVAGWEQEIDAQVYVIYGITPDDVESIAAAAPTDIGDGDADDDALDDE